METPEDLRLCFDVVELSRGNRVRLLQDGAEAYPRMLEAIAAARHSVLVEMYTFAGDATGLRFARALEERARSGVAVRVIYDSMGSLNTNTSIFQSLRAAGAFVTPFHPLGWFTWRTRDHRKLIVVDGRVAFLGGINLADDYAPTEMGGKGWRDLVLQIEGPEVGDLVGLFAENWREVEEDALWPHGPPPPTSSFPDGVLAAVLGSDRRRARRNLINRNYLHAIRQARKRIWIAVAYFVPSIKFHRALRAAARRGVDVRILAPVETDVQPVYHAMRAFFEGYLKRGIRILEYQGPVLHSKMTVIDGAWGIVGSYNLDHLSIFQNYELSAIILDRGFAAGLERVFEEDCRRAREVRLEEWRRRPWIRRLKERFWYQFRSFL